MNKQKQFLFYLSITTILLYGCSSSDTQMKVTQQTEKSVKVRIQKLETVSGDTGQSYIGTIEESVAVPLSFLATGIVEKVLVEEGQTVEKGQLLAVLNNDDFKNAWQISKAKLNQAEDAYNRLEPVYKKGSLPEVKFIEIKTSLEQARSMASISEKSLKDCKLYAPSSGIIGRKIIESGMSIIPGNPVFQLVKIEKVNVKIPVPENEISGFSKGMEARITVPALGNQLFEGKISEIGVLANPLSHTYMAKIELANPDKLLKPGMVCNATIKNPDLTERLIVPLRAVQSGASGEKFVYIADLSSGKAMKKIVEPGMLVSNGIVIRNGLTAGNLLIVEGYQKISDHSLIQIIQ